MRPDIIHVTHTHVCANRPISPSGGFERHVGPGIYKADQGILNGLDDTIAVCRGPSLLAADANQELSLFDRLFQFLRKPAVERRRSILFRWLSAFPGVPVPFRVPEIGWWLARNDFCGRAMIDDSFESGERRFVESVLQPGMTVLDIGAHHGLYTLLASRRVGPHGRVVAFEPSARERNHLLRHLRLNRCKNVQVEAVALGSRSGSGELFVVEGMQTGCNCLRPPNVAEPTTKIAVEIRTLDESLERLAIRQVD